MVIIEKKKGREMVRAPSYSRNLSITNKLIGDQDMINGLAHSNQKEYREASKDYRHAAMHYGEALRDRKLDKDDRLHIGNLYHNALDERKKTLHKAALEKATAHLGPIRKFITKTFDGWHLVGIFTFAILFSEPVFTASVIGNKGILNSYLGIFFFFLGLIGSYLLIWKKILVNRFQDQY